MKTSTLLMVFATLIFIGCSKSENYIPPVDNDELSAMLSFDGATPVLYSFKGDEVFFHRAVSYNGVKEIFFGCAKNNMQLHFELTDVTRRGTFLFGYPQVPESAYCLYSEGNYLIDSNHYSTAFREASGFIKIDSLSTTYMSGSFHVKCVQPPDYKILEISAGSFKGYF